MTNLFFRVLSQGLQAFTPIAAALAWCALADQPRRRVVLRRGLLLSVAATAPAAWWFNRSATRALDQAVFATLTLVIAGLCARGLRITRRVTASVASRGRTAGFALGA